MNIDYSIRNFRIFGPKGADISLKPITILTGCNSSGKSSLVKSILLLRNFVTQGLKDRRLDGRFRPQDYSLDFTSQGLKLGSFAMSRNRKSSDRTIGMSYVTTVKGSLMKFKVDLSFAPKVQEDINGWLEEFTISSFDDEEIILKVSVKEDGCHLEKLNMNTQMLNHFMRFYSYACLRQSKELADYYSASGNDYSSESFKSDFKAILGNMSSFSPVIGSHEADVYDDAYEDVFKTSKFQRLSVDSKNYGALKKVSEKKLLFYLPVLDYLEGRNADQIEALIIPGDDSHFQSDKEFYNGPADFQLIRDIISDFRNSGQKSFTDYYRNLENKKLECLAEGPYEVVFKDNDEDFFKYLRRITNVSNNRSGSVINDGKITFEDVYYILSNWQMAEKGQGTEFLEIFGNKAKAKVFSAYQSFFLYQISQLLLPEFAEGLNYIGNSHTTVQRVYTFDEKDDNLVDAIQDYISLRRKFTLFTKNDSYKLLCERKKEFMSYSPGTFVNNWLTALGIGEKVSIKVDKEGLGAKLLIRKKDEKIFHSLADEGYGVTQIVFILLRIEIEILHILENPRNYWRSTTSGLEGANTRTLAVEEPEVSLHPSMQSKLAEIMAEANSLYGVNFIVETHSEYLLRKIQTLVARKSLSSGDIAIYYFTGETDIPVREIGITPYGTFNQEFGPGFFDEADNLALSLMKSQMSI